MRGQISNPIDRLESALSRWQGRGNVPIFKFREISPAEVSCLVRGLGKSRSFGQDGIDVDFLKVILPGILNPLTYLINTSLRQGEWPNKWKIARVFPLLKDSSLNKMLPESYRPVSLLSTVSKVVERVAQVQLLEFFESTGQLNAAGHAYRKSLSTTTTIATIVDEMYQASEDKLISQLMTVDQSAAFDCISHQILLEKLEKYNVGTDARKWVANYLACSQYVTVGTMDSHMTVMETGIPQGSVMGPLLYAVYIHEMTEVVRDNDCTETVYGDLTKLFGNPCGRCGSVNMYADDATYNVSASKRETNKLKIEKTLKEIERFLLENELHLNVAKTTVLECMVPQKRGKTPGSPPQLIVIKDMGGK